MRAQETPFLLCRLGELKNEPKLFERSWECSKGHYARAKRDLGDYYYKLMHYEEAIPHFKQAVPLDLLSLYIA